MKKELLKKILLFIVLTVFFSFSIFLINSYLFWWADDINKNYIEENFIDYSVKETKDLIWTWTQDYKLINNEDKNIIPEKKVEHFNSASKLYFSYIPDDFINNIEDYSSLLAGFLNSDYVYSKLSKINVEFYKEIFDVRGKMKNMTIKLYWILAMQKEEFISVSIHEFAHYVDLYFLDMKVFKDLSNYFYDISWQETKVLKPWQKQIDFVSGYAMTNKYEDFAESFTYYVLHNKDFLEKSNNSNLLKSKYNFFRKLVFRNNEFENINFSNDDEVKNYYRDITKININLENFLQYLKIWI